MRNPEAHIPGPFGLAGRWLSTASALKDKETEIPGSYENGPGTSPKPVTEPGGFKAVMPSSRKEKKVITVSETRPSSGKFVKLQECFQSPHF